MMKTMRWSKAVVAASVVAGVLAACGGGDDEDTSPPPVTSTGSAYGATALVADVAGSAPNTDPNLVHGWGVAFNPNGVVWVNSVGSSKSTLYDGNGVVQALVVAVPPGTVGTSGPTGIVFNASTDFKVTKNALTGAAAFIFASEAGTISGWSPTVDRNNSVTVVDGGAAGKVYKGLAIAKQGAANFIYATDFHGGKVDVFDATYTPVTVPGGFTDPNLPAGFAPFGIQAIGDQIYVTYAKQDAAAHDDVAGAGQGFVNVFDTGGTLVKRLVTGGALNSPLGVALAPATFGSASGTLLVSNAGDGKINAFNATTGAILGVLSDTTGAPIVIDGLRDIAFGNDKQNQPSNTLFFAAGPANKTHGLYGRIDMK
jgi:uncharacterized protein (TIGR03118 family)